LGRARDTPLGCKGPRVGRVVGELRNFVDTYQEFGRRLVVIQPEHFLEHLQQRFSIPSEGFQRGVLPEVAPAVLVERRPDKVV
jgi:hypothetical protein